MRHTIELTVRQADALREAISAWNVMREGETFTRDQATTFRALQRVDELLLRIVYRTRMTR